MRDLLRETFQNSHLQNFFQTERDLIKQFKRWNSFDIVILDLYIKDISFIEKRYKVFMKSCENFLQLWNYNGERYYKNITFNSVKIWETIIPHCLILINTENIDKLWFFKTWDYIKFENKSKDFKKSLYENIILLITEKKISVRKLMKLWITQKKAREVYTYIKNLWIFNIDEWDNNKKYFYLENLDLLNENEINHILWKSV